MMIIIKPIRVYLLFCKNLHLLLLTSASQICNSNSSHFYKFLDYISSIIFLKPMHTTQCPPKPRTTIKTSQICFLINLQCCNPSFCAHDQGTGVAKMRAKRKLGSHITYSRECRKVWGNEPSHSQSNSHFGRWSPGGLPKF